MTTYDNMYARKPLIISEKAQLERKTRIYKPQEACLVQSLDRHDGSSVSSDSTVPSMLDDPFASSASETSEDTQTWYWESWVRDEEFSTSPDSHRSTTSPVSKFYQNELPIPISDKEPTLSLNNRNFASDNLSNLALSATTPKTTPKSTPIATPKSTPTPVPTPDLHRSDALRYSSRLTTPKQNTNPIPTVTYSAFPSPSTSLPIHKPHKSWPNRTAPSTLQNRTSSHIPPRPSRPRANTTPLPHRSTQTHMQYLPHPPSNLSACTTLTHASPVSTSASFISNSISDSSSSSHSPLYMCIRSVPASPGPTIHFSPPSLEENPEESEKSAFETDDEDEEDNDENGKNGGLSPFGSFRRRLLLLRDREGDRDREAKDGERPGTTESGKEKEKEKEKQKDGTKVRRVSDVLKGVFGIKRVV